ncbi:Lactate utilization protein B/C [Oleidesulfovibrio alaskensis G20]|jgi:L-lactate dehydrogenase complex protein LldG|uniref:Lactate utilization protein B/C n=1 Tax=Oleidesulfovibrio alaskensis (strain ATCC BAA-1058 / DSM 17464 / G20) TaxID=207559 RepID=Q310K5_OLEA2|nr:lactate utilization protein [Oleidesulfovibrio alaskensis]ABB38641.1 Lactate utilization protein B/C [Oleidesulfovibrio alaskensis G20]MBG0773876.1 lactate utilization protein [Oleidesulfovibrio alaskensis]
MSSQAREHILERLYKSAGSVAAPAPSTDWEPPVFTEKEKEERFVRLLETMKAEVVSVKKKELFTTLRRLLAEKNITRLAYGAGSKLAKQLEASWKQSKSTTGLVAVSGSAEAFRDELFSIEAGITSSLGGIADTGAIILWPDKHEPRLLSLVPPLHIVIVDKNQLFSSFSEAMAAQNWAGQMPTNALLVSGPSKTADIELILQFGVHGPKELLVLLTD